MKEVAAKVPAVTLGFWIIKILATTLGETAGDTLTMSWFGETTAHPLFQSAHLGYLIGTVILAIPLATLIAAQIKATRFHPLLYWSTIISSTMAGTTLADFCDRFLGNGTASSYFLGSALLLACVLITLFLWEISLGSISPDDVTTPAAEWFYWITITFSQTLGTALGDWVADTRISGHAIGYGGGALLFGGALGLVAALAYRSSISRSGLFWAAFVLSRPLGATVGDFLDKPITSGGLGLNRTLASLVL
ncbi:MAG: hypothetical protein JSS20_18520, partial [Proteobacteria bacterium]|nr:hypothetical protein [Pseudomonadota bacterium]